MGEVISSVRGGQARAFDKTIPITAVDQTRRPGAAQVRLASRLAGNARPSWSPDGAIVDADYADEHGLALGSAVSLQTATGKTLPFKVRGIFKPPAGGSPFGNVTISTTTFDAMTRSRRTSTPS